VDTRRASSPWVVEHADATLGVLPQPDTLVFLAVLMIFALAAPAYADQPSQGQENSEGRNLGVREGGPHCHINTRASGGPHGDILVVVAHNGGHVVTNGAIGVNEVFMKLDVCPFEV
jgi:hypothetical protein